MGEFANVKEIVYIKEIEISTQYSICNNLTIYEQIYCGRGRHFPQPKGLFL